MIAAGGGWFLGGQLGLLPGAEARRQTKNAAAAAEMPTGSVVPLKPILTNMKIPQDVWIRLEAGVVARPGEKISDELAATVAGDFMAFLRTVNLMQLRGPAGLEYLRTGSAGARAYALRRQDRESLYLGAGDGMKRRFLTPALLLVLSGTAMAQTSILEGLLPPGSASTSGQIIQMLAVLTVLSIAPGLLIMVTSFTRFAIAFSMLRAGLACRRHRPIW